MGTPNTLPYGPDSSGGEKRCRWGILGAAAIARKNWQGLRWAENSQLVAVASRSIDRSRQFIQECQLSVPQLQPVEAMGSYDELLARPDIDAVYIPIPTGIRQEWILKALKAGKHVLTEKPVCPTVAELQEAVDYAKASQRQLMDGVMFMHSARMAPMISQLNDTEAIGSIRRITSQFSFNAPASFFQENIRASHALEPLGCLGDLGWYNIRLTLCAMRGKLPEVVRGRTLRATPSGIPTEFSAELDFANGTTASLYCSFHTENEQWAHFSCEKGYLRLDDFVLPWWGMASRWATHKAQVNTVGCFMRAENHERYHAVDEMATAGPTAQETQMFRTFSKNVLNGTVDNYWPEIALKTQQVLEACLKSAQSGNPVSMA